MIKNCLGTWSEWYQDNYRRSLGLGLGLRLGLGLGLQLGLGLKCRGGYIAGFVTGGKCPRTGQNTNLCITKGAP